MKNFIANGETINITAAAVIASSQGVLLGSIFGVAEGAAAIGETAVIRLVGVFSLPKAAVECPTPLDMRRRNTLPLGAGCFRLTPYHR